VKRELQRMMRRREKSEGGGATIPARKPAPAACRRSRASDADLTRAGAGCRGPPRPAGRGPRRAEAPAATADPVGSGAAAGAVPDLRAACVRGRRALDRRARGLLAPGPRRGRGLVRDPGPALPVPRVRADDQRAAGPAPPALLVRGGGDPRGAAAASDPGAREERGSGAARARGRCRSDLVHVEELAALAREAPGAALRLARAPPRLLRRAGARPGRGAGPARAAPPGGGRGPSGGWGGAPRGAPAPRRDRARSSRRCPRPKSWPSRHYQTHREGF
jgi:hypothetical protein